jgi:hypothetical protein
MAPSIASLIYRLNFVSWFTLSTSSLWNTPSPLGTTITSSVTPITFASRDTRRESLPLFYESCVFLATTMWEPRSSLRDFTAALSPDSSAFFGSTFTHNFARIKRLDLYLGELDTKIVLDLNNTNDPVSVEYGFGFYFSDDAGFEAHVEGRKRVLIELCTFAMSIATREGPHKLQQSDLIHLYNTVRSILY